MRSTLLSSFIKEERPELIINRNELITELYERLEEKLGALSREEGSNINIIISTFADYMVYQNNTFIAATNKFANFARILESGYLSYSNGSLSGLRAKMLEINGVEDFKQYVTKATLNDTEGNLVEVTKAIATVIKIAPDYQNSVTYSTIADYFVSYMDVGTFSEAISDDTSPITVKANASNGQAVSYTFSLAKEISLELTVDVYLDLEEATPYDMATKVKEALDTMVAENYTNFIGKDFNIQDFYAVSLALKGVKAIGVTWLNKSSDDEAIAAFPDGSDSDMTTPDKFYLTLSIPQAGITLH
jgi:hypothetical protein